MADRLPNFLRTVAALSAGLFLLTAVLTAQPPAKPAAGVPSLDQPMATPDEMKARQEEIKKNFTQFKETLFRLATRLEKSDRQEAKDQAKVIRTALEIAEKQGVDGQFGKLVTGLAGAKNSLDYDKLSDEDKQLVKMLNEILTILQTDDETARLREEAKKLEAFIKELKAIKARQENVQVRTEAKVGNKDRLAEEQKDLKDQTQDVANRLGGKDGKDGKGGDAAKKDDRAEAKSDPKAGEPAGEKKDDTGEAKGDAKEGKDGAASEGKSGEPKDGAGDGKGGEPKDGDAKAGEGKSGEQDPKGSDGKGGDGKPSDSKGSAGKGQGQPQQGGSKGGGQPGQQGQPGGQQPQQPQQPTNQMPGRKEVAEAVPQQQQAQEKIQQDKRNDAGKNQDNAIDKLAQAIKELEKRLKQLREEEMKKLLANVEARCNKMLMMQIEVYENTKRIDENVTKNGGQKNAADIQKAQSQGDKEGEIVAEADRCLKLLESEGSAVAFAKVLEEVRQDMIAVQRRLGSAIVDKDTQTIEENIIAMLKDMIEALKKAQAELGKDPPPPGQGGGKPQNQKLINLLAELKLIRSMQAQVNMRTKMHGDKEKAEQAKDPLIKAELQQLANRQQKLEEMIEKLANGENQ
jgi:hypothetical protein